MTKFKTLIVCALTIYMLSTCNNKNDKIYFKNKIESVILVTIPYNFKLISYKSEGVFADNVEEFKLQFESNEFKKIINKIYFTLNKTEKEGIYYFNETISKNETIYLIIDLNNSSIQYTYVYE
jgi:hypothetical protein